VPYRLIEQYFDLYLLVITRVEFFICHRQSENPSLNLNAYIVITILPDTMKPNWCKKKRALFPDVAAKGICHSEPVTIAPHPDRTLNRII
jgi:hypothetical protein